jgi:signal recognition particle receptor subunit beta
MVDGLYDEKEMLGEEGGIFEFSQMEESNIFVSVIGGNVVGTDGVDVNKWWEWIGNQL